GFMNHTLLDDDVEVGKHLADVMYNLTETRDGGIIISAATEQHIRGTLQVAGRNDLIDDPRFTTVVTLIENIEEFMEMIKEGFSNMTSEEAIQKLQENDVPCAECHNHEEVINQPQINASDTVLVRDHPLMGSMRVVKSPSRFSGEQSEPGYHCPAHGENTESLLKEWSYTEEQIAEFRKKKVIS
ncbi:MAG: CoA transferase, partial [Methylococcales bacterium]|nr:CoA transferase [Methylococcales bacterium]